MTDYNPLDDALALIGTLVSGDEHLTDEDVIQQIDADGEYELEALVLTLAGIASGLCLSISDETNAPSNDVLQRFGSTRQDLEG